MKQKEIGKRILVILSVVFITLTFAGSASASYTTIAGKVTDGAGGPGVGGAKVDVTCNDKTETVYSSNGPSPPIGQYSVAFNYAECPDGSSVEVKATTSDGKFGTNTGEVTCVAGICALNLGIALIDVPVAPIPEFSTVVLFLTSLLVIGGYVKFRRRNN